MKQNKNIPQGYKDSPLGIIPQEWDVKRLGDIAEITSGGTPLRENVEYWNGDIPWITTSLIHNAEIYAAEEFISKDGLDNSAAKLLPMHTLLIAMYGQGKTRGTIAKLMIPAATNQACAAIIINNSQLANYVYYQLYSRYNYIRSLSNDGNQKNLSLGIISSILIPTPPLSEQQKIAEILTCWDAAIEKQTQLIEKLETRKRGLMQQLLTGKKRLKGFEGKWRVVKLSEVCEIKKGKTLTSNQTNDGIYPVIAGGKESPYYHDNYTDENVITISASGAYAGYTTYHSYKIWASDCSVIREKRSISNILYLYFLLAKNQNLIYSLQSGGAQPHIYPKDIANLKYLIPSIAEQTSIANILSTADNEIGKEKEKLTALRSQKKGLMQVLLTGKKRVKL